MKQVFFPISWLSISPVRIVLTNSDFLSGIYMQVFVNINNWETIRGSHSVALILNNLLKTQYKAAVALLLPLSFSYGKKITFARQQ